MNTNLPKFICAVSGLGAFAACGTDCPEVKQPNIIIIYGDDIGIGDLECYGTGVVKTPHVNRLAENGIRFVNSRTTSATSTPSRFGMLTGIYPWRQEGTGIARGDAAMIINPNSTTIADMAREAGYTTGAVGKWHLGLGNETGKQDWNSTISPGLIDLGFDYSFIMAATGDRVPCVYIENGDVVDLDLSDPIFVSYTTPFEGEPTGKNNPELLTTQRPSHGHDQAVVNGISRIGYMKGGKSALWRDQDIADRITEKAVEFIKNSSDNPFLLYFGTNDVHVPRVPHERFAGKTGLGPRGDALLEFDYSVSCIVATLEELGLTENTIIILSSDNGPVIDDGYEDQAVELLGDHNPHGVYRGGKYSAFDGGTRVPMIVSWSGVTPKGVISEAQFSQIDLFASVATLIGGTIADGVATDSRDASRTLLGEDAVGRDHLILQNRDNTLSFVKDGWKYIAPNDAEVYEKYTNIELGSSVEHQLYNLTQDPGETTNVLKDNIEKANELRVLLCEYAAGAITTLPTEAIE